MKNGPSPAWLQQRLIAIGLRSINRLVDVTNLISYDRARPLHVYDAGKLVGGEIVVRRLSAARANRASDRAGRQDLCGYARHLRHRRRAASAIGLGGVMGGESTGCSDETTDVFVESAWFDPIRTAQTGRTPASTPTPSTASRAASIRPPSCLAWNWRRALILDLCGGEPSEVRVAGHAPAPPKGIAFDRDLCAQLSGLDISRRPDRRDPDQAGL